MKRTIKILLLVCLFMLVYSLGKVTFASETNGQTTFYDYEIRNNQAIITNVKFEFKDNTEYNSMRIPKEINGYPVIAFEISEQDTNYSSQDGMLFSKDKTILYSYPKGKKLKNYTIPNTVTKIQEWAFYKCENIETVVIPSGIKLIPCGAFSYCSNLSKINIPVGVTKIAEGALEETSLVDVIIPNTVTEILAGAFSNCSNLKTLTIPSSVKFMEDGSNADGVFFWDMEGEPLLNRITLNVEKDSYAEEYAKKKNIKYNIINSKEDSKTPISLLNNEIKIESTTNVIPENTKLLVKEVTTGNNYNIVSQALETDVNKFVLYDISLESNNAKIQPNGKVKISIPVPNGFDKNNISVYRVEDKENKIEYSTKIEKMEEKEYAVFETDHFSNYVIAEKTTKVEQLQETQKQENLQHKLDNEPKTGIINVVSIVSIIVAVSLIGFTVCQKKMYK